MNLINVAQPCEKCGRNTSTLIHTQRDTYKIFHIYKRDIEKFIDQNHSIPSIIGFKRRKIGIEGVTSAVRDGIVSCARRLISAVEISSAACCAPHNGRNHSVRWWTLVRMYRSRLAALEATGYRELIPSPLIYPSVMLRPRTMNALHNTHNKCARQGWQISEPIEMNYCGFM